MTITAAPTRFIESFHYLPDPRWTGAILAIRRAGHVAAGRDYAVDRMTLQGDDLIYCLSGAGVVRTGEEQHEVGPGELVWLSGSAPHAHAAVPDDPWTVMWMRLDGPQTETCRARLMGESATLKIQHGVALLAWFQRLFTCMRLRAPESDLLLHGLASDLLILLDAERRGSPGHALPAPIARLTQEMSAQPHLPWNEEAMQSAARISAAHLRRLFRQHMQITPRAWLRRERIMLAQEMLLAPQTKIAAVADACGFADIYHFSREFKKSVGTGPREWRQNELGFNSGSPRGVRTE